MSDALPTIRNAAGEHLEATLHRGRGACAVAVLGHGVTANKDRPFLVALAEGLERAGVAALRFSFAGNGGSEGRFEDATVTKEVEDLGSVLDAAAELGPGPVAYVGHSMGAAVGVLRASRDERIGALVSLAGMVDTRGFCRRKFGALVPGRDVMWEKPGCPLSQAFVDDMDATGSALSRASEVRVPWLLVHGDADTVVPIGDSEAARAAAGGPAELVRVAGADHVFTGPATAVMVGAVVPWLARVLGARE